MPIVDCLCYGPGLVESSCRESPEQAASVCAHFRQIPAPALADLRSSPCPPAIQKNTTRQSTKTMRNFIKSLRLAYIFLMRAGWHVEQTCNRSSGNSQDMAPTVLGPHAIGILGSAEAAILGLFNNHAKRKTRLDESPNSVCMASTSHDHSRYRAAVMRSVPTLGADNPCRRPPTKCARANESANPTATESAAKCRARQFLQTSRRCVQTRLERNHAKRARSSLPW